jgi:hypothetical protein
MKKSILFMATALIFGQIASAQVQDKLTAGIGYSTDVEKHGVMLKMDYHLTKKFGIGFRAMSNFGAWDNDWTFNLSEPYQAYQVNVDYTKGYQTGITLDAIYHLIGNNQDSKFGMRVEGGLGYFGWTQNSIVKSNAPVDNPAYYTYNNEFGGHIVALKTGLGFEYKIGKGKAFLDVPLYIEVYGTDFYNYTNQKWGNDPNYNISNSKSTSFRIHENPSSYLNLNLGYQFSF